MPWSQVRILPSELITDKRGLGYHAVIASQKGQCDIGIAASERVRIPTGPPYQGWFMSEHTAINVGFLPKPNTVEVIFSDELAPQELTKTAFMIALFDDGSIMLANNVKRGTETPGGHVEEGETLLEGALRETMEEIGCEVTDVVPIGYLRMTSEGTVPEDYPYPHPLGYQQFFAGRIVKQHEYVADYECTDPVRTYDSHHRPSVNLFWDRAKAVLGIV